MNWNGRRRDGMGSVTRPFPEWAFQFRIFDFDGCRSPRRPRSSNNQISSLYNKFLKKIRHGGAGGMSIPPFLSLFFLRKTFSFFRPIFCDNSCWSFSAFGQLIQPSGEYVGKLCLSVVDNAPK